MNQYQNNGMQGKNCPYTSCTHNKNNICQQYGAIITGHNQCTHYQKRYTNTTTYANTKKYNKTNGNQRFPKFAGDLQTNKKADDGFELSKIFELDKRLLWPITAILISIIAGAYIGIDKITFIGAEKIITVLLAIIAIWLGHKVETQKKQNKPTEENKNE